VSYLTNIAGPSPPRYPFGEMTDSATQVRGGKRERLVASARDLLHRQGVQRTTLTEVAEAADVPPGNVYYYFKTKDELVKAVTEAHADSLRAMLGSFERHRSPRARLKAFLRSMIQTSEVAARYGCPIGSLCQELDKREDGLDRAGATAMAVFIDWAEEQFRLMGQKDAHDLAVTLIAGYQGAAVLTNTFRDPKLMTREARRLERWIDSLS
jgi:TetR/AcrR family transcriptional regulator, transcriptional repressor for nem operon